MSWSDGLEGNALSPRPQRLVGPPREALLRHIRENGSRAPRATVLRSRAS